MALNFSKLSSWLIVIVGLLVIGWTVFSSYDFFSGQKSFPQVFKQTAAEGSQKEVQQKTAVSAAPKDQAEAQALAQAQMQQTIGESISKLFPAETTFQVLNMTSWIAFASFLVFAGAQIAGIGVKLLINKS
ncbi:MAG: hypothetical protein WCX77_00695 [Candidatus Paceibacterota bacterium]|jgi:hypothetical protein